MDRNFKLLSKTSIVYVILTFIAFFATATFLFQEIDDYLNDEVEDRFRFFEHRAMSSLRRGHKLKPGRKFFKVERLKQLPAPGKFPAYKDTTMHDPFMEKESVYRIKEVVIKYEDTIYQLKMIIGLDEFIILKEAVAKVFIPVFIILAAIVVLINFALSGFFLKPFYKILEQIKTYKVGNKNKLYHIETTTDEFRKMQSLFMGMVDRIEDDYRKLKEYTENMAHEVQTPLTVMRNKVLELMSEEEIMKEKSAVVKALYDEINHLSILGSTLNLLTKIENNEFRNSEKLNTTPVLKEICTTYKELAGLKNIDLEVNILNDHYLVIDPKLFRIMIDNLLRNSLRYSTTEGGIKIYSDEKVIRISNFGEKLAVEPEKLFERFVTANNNSSSIGLGLSIVKKICDLNGIQIEYKYENNQHLFELKHNYSSN